MGARLVLSSLLQLLFLGALVFVPAGTFHYLRGWTYLATHVVASIVTVIALLPHHRGVIEERMRPPVRADQPLSDVVLTSLLVTTLLATFAFAPLDRFRLHVWPGPGIVATAIGVILHLFGFALMGLAMAHNDFASTVVRHQSERGHTVARTGVYSVVRHPMYTGAILWMIGTALWLGSYAAALLVVVPTATLVVRIFLEEKFLRRTLAGYEEYTHEVRWRLFPRLW